MSCRIIFVFIAFVLCTFTSADLLATTYVVDPAGGGDYTTISDAVADVPSGSSIDIMPGVYPESFIFEKSLNLSAMGSVGSVVLDGELARRIAKARTSIVLTFTGIEFRNGYAGDADGCGAAMHIDTGADVTFDQCRFIDNRADWDGAIYAGLAGTTVIITDCLFEGNYAYHNCPAAGVLLDGVMVIEGCTFVDNNCPNICGAVASWYGDLTVHHSLFLGNTGGTAAALRIASGSGSFFNNTFHDNTGYTVVHISSSGPVSFDHNIMTTNPQGDGLYMSSGLYHDCNLFYDIAGEAVNGGLAPDEVYTDPLYCDYPNEDFHLCIVSPALPQNNECGKMGAFAQGCETCGPIANEDKAWGEVKMLFR